MTGRAESWPMYWRWRLHARRRGAGVRRRQAMPRGLDVHHHSGQVRCSCSTLTALHNRASVVDARRWPGSARGTAPTPRVGTHEIQLHTRPPHTPDHKGAGGRTTVCERKAGPVSVGRLGSVRRLDIRRAVAANTHTHTHQNVCSAAAPSGLPAALVRSLPRREERRFLSFY